MKYNSKANVYRASNLSFDCNTGIGLSYDWYAISKKFGDMMVFNHYNYSPTTNRHWQKLYKLFAEKGIKIDYDIEAPKGLHDLDSAIEHYQRLIRIEQAAIAKPRSRKDKNLEREQMIDLYEFKIGIIKRLKGE